MIAADESSARTNDPDSGPPDNKISLRGVLMFTEDQLPQLIPVEEEKVMISSSPPSVLRISENALGEKLFSSDFSAACDAVSFAVEALDLCEEPATAEAETVALVQSDNYQNHLYRVADIACNLHVDASDPLQVFDLEEKIKRYGIRILIQKYLPEIEQIAQNFGLVADGKPIQCRDGKAAVLFLSLSDKTEIPRHNSAGNVIHSSYAAN